MKRLQRLRSSKHIRDLVAETEFTRAQLVQPLFGTENIPADEPIAALKGVSRQNPDSILRQIEQDLEAGVSHFILFNVPAQKGLRQFNHGFSTALIKRIKGQFGNALHLWVDTCLCAMTTHGHCCIFKEDHRRDHGQTLIELSRMATEYIASGADGISPSDMMDGRVGAIRGSLDKAGFEMAPIMSYSTKFASSFYGPFREAAQSTPQFGDRTQYQIDVRNRGDALASSLRCSEEGADLLMVKPGLSSLDLIQPIHALTGKPVGAYQVSGEYASLALLAEKGLIDFNRALLETWQVFKRAGTRYIITYGARYAKSLGVK